MLTFFFALLFGGAAAHAQLPAEYNFRQQSTVVGDRFSTDDDDAPQLTMSCLAANGYGQWTISMTPGTGTTGVPTSNFVEGWYLLPNGLYKPSTELIELPGPPPAPDPTHPGCFPPGVVQDGSLTPPSSEMKATANLDGMEGFIWPDATARSSFDLSGFTAADLDLSFSFLSNPQPGLAPGAGNMHIIPDPTPGTAPTIHSWPSVSTESPTGITHDVVSETDFRDNFDWCADAHFVYITWASTDNSMIPGQEEVWVTVVPIGSSTPVAGFPMQVNNSALTLDGKFPTITCDPRHNRAGTPVAAFDIAYVQPSTSTIVFGSWNSGWTHSPSSLGTNYWNPAAGSPGSTETWTVPMHARIVRNSVFGGSSSLGIYAIVNSGGLTHSLTAASLIYYPPSGFTTAAYVAGVETAPAAPISWGFHPPVHDEPIIAFADPYDNQANWHSTDETHCLYQYDLGSSGLPAEFPLCIVRGADVAAAWPDLFSAFTPDPSLQDTRTVINQSSGSLENDPTNHWYVAAVNQMGIHVHWIANTGTIMSPVNTHFYARDMNRTFDEAIDENTLMTDQCTINDGSSTGTNNHGGTVGAQLQDNMHFAIWTDPNYGADFSDHTGDKGLWQPGTLFPVGHDLDPMVGTLNFEDNNVTLQIGGLSSTDGGAVLTDMPYFYCNFDQEMSEEIPIQGITIGPSSTFDYYGLIENHNSDGSVYAPFGELRIGSPFALEGATGPIANGGGIITLHGAFTAGIGLEGGTPYWSNLNVHGGAVFAINDGGSFESVYEGNIQFLYDGNVYPEPPVHKIITGHAYLHGVNYVEESEVRGYIPDDSVAPIINIVGYHADEASGSSYHSGFTSYMNLGVHGVSEILISPELKPADDVRFDTDDFEAVRIHDLDPEFGEFLDSYGPGKLTVDNSSFEFQHGRSIFVESTEDPEGGTFGGASAVITINNNRFHTIDSHDRLTDADAPAAGTYGIYLVGLDANYNDGFSSFEGKIMVTDNFFTDNNWSVVNPGYSTVPNLQYSAAICFENTTGNIIGNTISDPAYSNGIWLKATIPSHYSEPPTSRTFVCSNTISDLHAPAGDEDPASNILTGIRMEFYKKGYIKLNTIQDCEIGLSSNGDDFSYGFMVFNTIDNTHNAITYDIQQAIRVTANSSLENVLDLSGVHGGSDDIAGFNDISGTYSDWQTGLVTVGCNAIFNLGSWLTTITGACSTCTNFGENNLHLCTGPLSGCTQPSGTYAYIISGLCGGTPSTLNDVNNNFWGLDGSSIKIDPANGSSPGSDPENWNSTLGSSQLNSLNITYTIPTGTLSLASSFSGVSCGSSFAGTKPAHPAKPMATDTLSPQDSCWGFAFLSNDLFGDHLFTLAVDTAKYGIMHCYEINEQAALGCVGGLSDATAYGGNGPLATGVPAEQKFLLGLLQLRPGDGSWLCGIVQQLSGTFYTTDTSWSAGNTVTNEGLSVDYWVMHNSPCPNYGSNDTEIYVNSRGSQIRRWLDTLDTSKVPLDTTIYSMHDLGLDSVLKYASLLGVSEGGPSIITNASAYPNPAGTGTVISFGTTKEAYVMVHLYDILGHEVSGAGSGTNGFESVVEAGNHSIPFSLAGLPSGTYFARIQTTYGEVQSVKIVKE